MKHRKTNWTAVAIFALYGIAVGAGSAYLALKFVSPCVCVYVSGGRIS